MITPGDESIGALLLAAGESTRLGEPKQLIELNGQSLLRRTAELLAATGFSPVIVLLGFLGDRLQRELRGLPVDVVQNPDWKEGMASSIRAGVARLLEISPNCTGAVLTVCDQILLDRDILLRLSELHRKEPAKAVASCYDAVVGVPAIIPRHRFGELESLRGDQGARGMLRARPAELFTVPFPGGGVDLDRPEDLKRLRNGP